MILWGSHIRRYRRAQSLSQAELAEKLGVEQATISRWERGFHEPDLKFRRRLQDLLLTRSTRSDEVLFHRVSCSPFAVKISDRFAKNMAASKPAATIHGVAQSLLAEFDYRPLFSEMLSNHWSKAVEAGFFDGNIASVHVYNDWNPADGGRARYCASTWTPATLSDDEIALISEFIEIGESEFLAIPQDRRFTVTTLDDLMAR